MQLSNRLETYSLSLVTNVVASKMGRLVLLLLASKSFDSLVSIEYLKGKGFVKLLIQNASCLGEVPAQSCFEKFLKTNSSLYQMVADELMKVFLQEIEITLFGSTKNHPHLEMSSQIVQGV